MAKKKSKKRGWSGAPPARPSSGSRPAAATRPPAEPTARSATESARSTRPAAAVTTEDEAAPEQAPARPVPRQARTTTRPAPQATSNRTVRKEEARKQREMLRRKAARRRTMRRTGIIAGIVVAVGAAAALIVLTHKPAPGRGVDPHTLPGVTADTAPWPPETAQLASRIEKMGLPPLGGEQTAYHIHQNLVIYVDGTKEPVPSGLGLIPPKSFAEIHTHDNSGTIHVEAGATRRFTLGTIFDVWGVLFTKDQLGAYRVKGDKQIRVFVNGKLYHGDPTTVPLGDQQVIVLTYGTQAQVPKQIPSVFHYAQPPTVAGATPSSAPSASAQPSASAAPSASPS